MAEIRRHRATVIVAHRFSTLRRVERIVAKGRQQDRVASNGTDQEL